MILGFDRSSQLVELKFDSCFELRIKTTCFMIHEKKLTKEEGISKSLVYFQFGEVLFMLVANYIQLLHLLSHRALPFLHFFPPFFKFKKKQNFQISVTIICIN